jgi:hypothetical protein
MVVYRLALGLNQAAGPDAFFRNPYLLRSTSWPVGGGGILRIQAWAMNRRWAEKFMQ